MTNVGFQRSYNESTRCPIRTVLDPVWACGVAFSPTSPLELSLTLSRCFISLLLFFTHSSLFRLNLGFIVVAVVPVGSGGKIN